MPHLCNIHRRTFICRGHSNEHFLCSSVRASKPPAPQLISFDDLPIIDNLAINFSNHPLSRSVAHPLPPSSLLQQLTQWPSSLSAAATLGRSVLAASCLIPARTPSPFRALPPMNSNEIQDAKTEMFTTASVTSSNNSTENKDRSFFIKFEISNRVGVFRSFLFYFIILMHIWPGVVGFLMLHISWEYMLWRRHICRAFRRSDNSNALCMFMSY